MLKPLQTSFSTIHDLKEMRLEPLIRARPLGPISRCRPSQDYLHTKEQRKLLILIQVRRSCENLNLIIVQARRHDIVFTFHSTIFLVFQISKYSFFVSFFFVSDFVCPDRYARISMPWINMPGLVCLDQYAWPAELAEPAGYTRFSTL
uniref:Uncharacterized protein n=1 Tax=Strigamia maritima TaxID=126957 RepID=T1JF05_STRMM